ncbi:MAG: hypothetical protein RLY31_786 [Bacteroidota bacterium]
MPANSLHRSFLWKNSTLHQPLFPCYPKVCIHPGRPPRRPGKQRFRPGQSLDQNSMNTRLLLSFCSWYVGEVRPVVAARSGGVVCSGQALSYGAAEGILRGTLSRGAGCKPSGRRRCHDHLPDGVIPSPVGCPICWAYMARVVGPNVNESGCASGGGVTANGITLFGTRGLQQVDSVIDAAIYFQLGFVLYCGGKLDERCLPEDFFHGPSAGLFGPETPVNSNSSRRRVGKRCAFGFLFKAAPSCRAAASRVSSLA